jgi:hypothetical protein
MLLRSVHMHKMVCVVCTHIIMECIVCVVFAERRGVWLVHAQCGYMLSRDNLVNGARRVLLHGGGILNSDMEKCVE